MRRSALVLVMAVLLLSSALQASGLFVVGDIVEVTDGVLNLREAPSVGQVVWAMPEGTQMEVIGGPVEQGCYTWWQLFGHEHSGWSSDHRLVKVAEVGAQTTHRVGGVDFHMRLASAVDLVDDSGDVEERVSAYWIAETQELATKRIF